MSESSQEAISIRGLKAPEPVGAKPLETASKTNLARLSLVAFISILMLFVGWGALYFYSTLKSRADSAAGTELDGIELVTPLFESGEPSGKSGFIVSDSVAATTGRNRRPAAGSASLDSLAANENADRRHVWLTGTIEFDEAEDRIAVPQRISGSPNDTSTRR